MAQNHSLMYFLLFDLTSNSEIGNYVPEDEPEDIDNIINKAEEIIAQYGDPETAPKSKKNKIDFDSYSIFLMVDKENHLYLATFYIDSKYSNSSVFEFFEDIEHQGLTKHIGEDGYLSIVGKQNLMYVIDKYFKEGISVSIAKNSGVVSTNSSSGSAGNSNTSGNTNDNSMNDSIQNDKISVVSAEVKSVENDVKLGVQKLVSNVENVKELENRSIGINMKSQEFKKHSEELKRKSEKRKKYLKIALYVLLVVAAVYIFYEL